MDIYIEHLVRDKIETKDRGIRILAIFLPFGYILSSLVLSLPLFVLLPILFLSYYLWIAVDREYEYLYLGGSFGVDKIIHRGKRKQMIDISPEEILEIQPFRPEREEGWKREGISVLHVEGLGGNRPYCILFRKQGKKQLLVFDGKDSLLKEMKLQARGKIQEEV